MTDLHLTIGGSEWQMLLFCLFLFGHIPIDHFHPIRWELPLTELGLGLNNLLREVIEE
jgi:hypothetical protein